MVLTWAEAINDYKEAQKDKLNAGIPNKAIDRTLYVHFQIRSSSGRLLEPLRPLTVDVILRTAPSFDVVRV